MVDKKKVDNLDPHFMELLIKDQVNRQVDSYLKKKWGDLKIVVKIVVPLLTILVGILGISQYLSFSSLQNTQKLANELRNKADSLSAYVRDAQTLKKQADTTLYKSIDFLNQTLDRAMVTNENITKLHGKIIPAAEAIDKMHENINQRFEYIRENYKSVLQQSDSVKRLYNDLIEKRGGLNKLEAVSKELIKVKTTETIVLRSHQETPEIHLLDFQNLDLDTLQYYVVRLSVESMGKNFDLKYQIRKPNSYWGQWESEKVTAPQRKSIKKPQSFPMKGTPYTIKIEYVNTGFLDKDFIFLKLIPSELSEVTFSTSPSF